MGRLILVFGIAGVFALHPGGTQGQSFHFDRFKVALDGGDHLAALELIASGADTTTKSSDYLANRIKATADRAFNSAAPDCDLDYSYAVHTKALMSYASDANSVLRKQQELGAQLIARYADMDRTCRARTRELILRQMNALPNYAGALGVTFMELFPEMGDEEVEAFLADSKWVRLMVLQHERYVNTGSTNHVARFITESLAVVNAVTYAALYEDRVFPDMPAPVEYVRITHDLAVQAMRSKDKEMRRYSSLFSISYVILMMDETIAKAVVTEENLSEHLALVIDIVSHWRSIDLPKQLRGAIELLTPMYYSALLRVYFIPFYPETARLPFLRGAELIAIDQGVISETLGPCALAQAAATVRAQSLLYDFQINEGSRQLLDLFSQSDSIFVSCANVLGPDTYPDTWKGFQNCFAYCTSLGEYQASAAMMAIAAETLAKEEFATTRAAWMDFMLASFNESIRHDTIMNSTRASRDMVDFVRHYVTGKEGPYTDQQALFVLLHLAGIVDILAQPVQDRCTLIESVSQDVVKFGATGGVTKLVELLKTECNGQGAAVVQAAREFVDSDQGEVFRAAQIYAYSILFAQGSYSKKRSDYDRYVALNEAHYGVCHRYTVSSVGAALSWYNENHSPAEVKQFLDDFFARYYRPECQALINWLPAFMMVRNTLADDLALKAILEANMRDLFKGLRAVDCKSFEEKEAFVDWKVSSYSSFKEVEANARESMVVLSAMGGGDEEAWFNETTPYVKKRYLSRLMLTYNAFCSAFNGVGDVRADSLCRYAALMEELLRKEPSLAIDFADQVQDRLAECASGPGASEMEFTSLLSEGELSAMDMARFNSYIKWYGQMIQDTVMTISLRWHLTDREALVRELRPIIDQHGFMLALARRKPSLSAYCELLVQWASWTPSTVHKDSLLSVLESIYERYPELGVSSWNTLSLMHTNTDRSIIIQDRYQKYVSLDYTYLELIELLNSVVYSDLWVSLDTVGRSVLCKEVLDVLSGYDLKNVKDANAWQSLARVGALLLIEEGSDTQVREMHGVMSSRVKTLRQFGQIDEDGIQGREYQMFIELLKARSKPKVPTLSLERSLMELMKEAQHASGDVDAVNLLRGYAAVLQYNPAVVENSDILTQGVMWMSFRLWYDFLNKEERFMSRYIQVNLSAFWKVVSATVMDRDTHRLSLEYTNTWVETLWLQNELLAQQDVLNGLEAIGFDEELFWKLETTYWSYPEARREKPEEFKKIAAMYAALYSNRPSAGESRSCPAKASVVRYWEMVSTTAELSVKTLQTREALSRYVKLACAGSRDKTWAGMDEHADTWIRFPLRTAILEFDRDEAAGVYRLRNRTEDAMDERVLGSIATIEESWRGWTRDMETGDGSSDNTGVPAFWEGVVRAASTDTTIKHFVLVPDGIYYNVNPAVLPLESTGQIRVDVVVDLEACLRPEVPTNRIGSVVLVGGLDYGGNEGQRFALADRLRSDTGLDRGSGWVKLPGTEREVNSIADKLRVKRMAVDLITGSDATSARLGQLAFPQAIHLATHGFVDKRGGAERSAGLVLSGANAVGEAHRVGENYLYAEDIRALDLFACDLVVLSACRTALSSNGHGQGDIIKAFKDAGVSKVVASSWAVPDECTSLLMEHFYDYYLSGVAASQALAEAQRKVALRFPNKRDWAAFMVYH